MSGDDLIPHIPFLRRHARLLTGSTAVGDEYVRLCLELVVAEPERLEGGDLRVQLFKAFHASWAALNTEPDVAFDAVTKEERLEAGLAKLAGLERRVLLLVAVEEFSQEQAAEILGLDVEVLREHFVRAQANLHQSVSVPVLIIEDEAMIAMELSDLVTEMGLSVAGIAPREHSAVETAERVEPGLVLADIQLADDGSGIVAAREILKDYTVPIVFVTGYPERLLSGEGQEPAFVVAKPFNPHGLKATIAQALEVYGEPESAASHRAALLKTLRKITGQDVGKRVADPARQQSLRRIN